jgi:hypothetical protein
MSTITAIEAYPLVQPQPATPSVVPNQPGNTVQPKPAGTNAPDNPANEPEQTTTSDGPGLDIKA